MSEENVVCGEHMNMGGSISFSQTKIKGFCQELPYKQNLYYLPITQIKYLQIVVIFE